MITNDKIIIFAKIINGWKPLTIFDKCSIWDIRLGSEYTCEKWKKFVFWLQPLGRIMVLKKADV